MVLIKLNKVKNVIKIKKTKKGKEEIMNKKLCLFPLLTMIAFMSLNAQVFERFNPDDKMQISIDSQLDMIDVGAFKVTKVPISEKLWNKYISEGKKKYSGFTASKANREDASMMASAWEIIVWCNLMSELNGYKPYYIDNAGAPIRKVPKDNYDFFLDDWSMFGGENARRGYVACDLKADGYRLPTKAEYEKFFDKTKYKSLNIMIQASDKSPLTNDSIREAVSYGLKSVANREAQPYHYVIKSSYSRQDAIIEHYITVGLGKGGSGGVYSGYSFFLVKSK